MEHRDARLLASRASDTALGEAEERDLAVHLVACAPCKSFYEEVGRTRTAIADIVPREAPEGAVEAAVYRATTVLGGEADPGPVEIETEEEPIPSGPWSDEDTGPLRMSGDVAAEAFEPLESLFAEPSPTVIGGPPQAPTAFGEIEEPSPTVIGDPLPDEAREPPEPETTSGLPDLGPLEVPGAGYEDPGVAPTPTVIGTTPPPYVPEVPAEVPWPTTEVAAPAVGHDLPDVREPSRPRVGPLVIGILVTLVVAGLAWFLVLQGPRLGNNGSRADLPSAASIRQRVTGAFDRLQSLKASYTVDRLGMYRGNTQEDGSVDYSFTNGRTAGRVVYESPDRLREERTLEAADVPAERVTRVRTPEEARTMRRIDDETTFTVVANPPFGPPDGDLIPPLGVLEEAIGVPADLLVAAEEIEVVERTAAEDREAYRVRFEVTPTHSTRADRIEMLIDTASYIPIRIVRSLDRSNAEVLGPPQVLGPDAIDAAFGDAGRIETERVQLRNTSVNDVILPGEFALETPEGVEAETVDANFVEVSEAEIDDALPFDPLRPATTPKGYREQVIVAFEGQPGRWGPDASVRAPSGIAQTRYSDGRVAVVVSQRRVVRGPVSIRCEVPDAEERQPCSPLSIGTGLPIITETEVRGGNEFTYGISPEVPPHVYGWIGDIFVMAVGYAPKEDLVRFAASLSQGVPEPTGQGPTTSPQASPDPDG